MLNINHLSDRSIPDYLEGFAERLAALRPAIDAHITMERITRYVTAIADTPAPSTTASAMRAPVLRELLVADGALADARITLDVNFRNTASTVMLTGDPAIDKPLWYFGHLDTISYLVKQFDGERYPLVPFCYHLTTNGRRDARCYRFDLWHRRYFIAAEGSLESRDGTAFFRAADPAIRLQPGDRVVPVTNCAPAPDGHWTGHFDNAGGVAALAIAAPILAQAGIDAMLAFPDEEEGPAGSGNQVMGRGGSRIIDRLAPPDLAIIADMQQAADPGGVVNSDNNTQLGKGAVLSEFSSLARGAVTPPPLLALARHLGGLLPELGVQMQESNNAYTSRSDDVSVLLKTPNILLLGFPGINRHFDAAEPKANLSDIVDLSKALVYMALLQPALRVLNDELGGMR
ncbi:MAG: hypothetical protein JWM58_1857 [Rhizobium sp.]|nr:hypothetical protein [Rhizobium sp.]